MELLLIAQLINNSSEIVKSLSNVGIAVKKIHEYFASYSDEQRKRLTQKTQRLANQKINLSKISNIPTLVSSSEGLAYSEHEPNLREMFENLIVKVLDGNSIIHPSYAEIVKQLSDDDARSFLMLYAHTIKYREDYKKFVNDNCIQPFECISLDDGDICYENDISPIILDKRNNKITIPSYEKLSKPKYVYVEEYGAIPEEYSDDIEINIQQYIINNLCRLGLVELSPRLEKLESLQGKWLGNSFIDKYLFNLVITDFGFEFAKAVQLDDM